MPRTGRPRTNGVQKPEVLIRATIVLEAFRKARESGTKYDVAIREAAAAVTAFDNTMKTSEAMVKRVLKEFMPEEAEEVLRVTKLNLQTDMGNGVMIDRLSYAIGIVPKTKYFFIPYQNKQR